MMAFLLCSLFKLKPKKQLYKYGFEVHFGKAAFMNWVLVFHLFILYTPTTHIQHMRSTVHWVKKKKMLISQLAFLQLVREGNCGGCAISIM